MASTRSYVQVAPDNTGKKIDANVVTESDGTSVDRQVVSVGSAENEGSQLGVSVAGQASVRDAVADDLMRQILIELRVQNQLLHTTLNSRDDLDDMRAYEGALTFQQTS